MSTKPTTRMERTARLRWVPVAKMTVNELAQRDRKQSRVDYLVENFDPEQFDILTVNHVGDEFHIIDGQHREEAFKLWLGDGNWEDQQLQCWTYEGLSDEEEADVFLKRNDVLAVASLAKFRIGVKAGRPVESDVDRIVRAQGLCVSRDKKPGAIGAVGTLMKLYRLADGPTLGRALRIVRDAYGDPGLEAAVIEGAGLLCHRYNGDLDDEVVVARLSSARGKLGGLLNKAENLRKQTGNPRGQCVAAAAVEIMNGVKGGKKLPKWWDS